MTLERNYEIDGHLYRAVITFRRRNGIGVRLSKDGETFLVSADYPYRLLNKKLDEAVGRCIGKILKKVEKSKTRDPEYQDGSLYVLGEKIQVGQKSQQEVEAYLKKIALDYYPKRVAEWEDLMGISPRYKVGVRSMSSRYGVNSSRTHKVTFSTRTICYSSEIIDALIVHELAHHFERNHQPAFYKIVYRYCPDYDALHAKLRKGIHA